MAISIYERKKIEKKIKQTKKKIEFLEHKREKYEEILKGNRSFDYSSKKYIAIFCIPIVLIIISLIIAFKLDSTMKAIVFFSIGLLINLILFFIVRLIDKEKMESKLERIKVDVEKLKRACERLENGLENVV